jgi:ribosomal protein S18 acetylase RimI-like enzyme
MRMQIIPFKVSMSADVALAYSRTFGGIPHCHPVSAESFADALAAASNEWPEKTLTCPNRDARRAHPRVPLHAGAAWVATEGVAIVGFVHVALAPAEQPGMAERGAMRCFWYERGQRAAGQALLNLAAAYLWRCGARCIAVWRYEYRLPFYHVEHATLTERLEHVHALLGRNGCVALDADVVLDWPNYAAALEPQPPVPVEVALEWVSRRDSTVVAPTRPGLLLRAYQGERRVGFCICASEGDYQAGEEAQDWVYTPWLTVVEDLRGLGLGRYLLLRALHEMRDVGYRHASLCCSARNHGALLLYSSLGYRAVDWTRAWQMPEASAI